MTEIHAEDNPAPAGPAQLDQLNAALEAEVTTLANLHNEVEAS